MNQSLVDGRKAEIFFAMFFISLSIVMSEILD